MMTNRDCINDERIQSNATIFDGYCKAISVLSRHDHVAVSVSGGKDSDIMVDIISRIDKDKKCRYIWFDTGLEYAATKRHLTELEEKYGITIERIKAIKPIPTSCKEYGVPFLNKFVSDMIYRLQSHDFKWEDEDYDTLIEKHPKCKGALTWYSNNNREVGKYGYSMFNIDYNKNLRDFLIANPPPFKISSKCCTYAKKDVAHKWADDNGIDLMIVGVRKAEGGVRASLKTCFDSKEDTYDMYRPLFWYKNEDEKQYDDMFEIKHSDCYEIWGFTRTGCVGCPYNRKFDEELEVIREREPQMYKACQFVFGKSYDYTRKYRRYQQAAKDGKLLEINGKKHCLDDLLEVDDD